MSALKNAELWTVVLLATFCAAPAPQTRPAAADQQQAIKSLVAELSSDDPPTRTHAQKGLIRFGASAKPFLENATRSTDADVAARAEVALQMIDDPLNPTWVSIDVKDTPAAEIIQSLADQSGTPLRIYQDPAKRRANETKLTIHAVDQPLWAVLLKVCEAVDLRPDCRMPDDLGGWSLREDSGTWDHRNTTVQGPFAVHISSINRRANLSFENAGRVNQETNIGGICHAEQKVHAQAIQNIRVTRCEDEKRLPIPAHAAYSFNQFADQGYGSFNIALDPAKATRISILEGEVDFVVESKRDHIEVGDLLKNVNVQRTAGTVRLEVRDCRMTAAQRWAIRIIVYRGGRDEVAWRNLIATLRNAPPIIEDSQHRALMNWGQITTKPDGDTTEIEFPYANFVNYGRGIPTDPVKLIWDVPTRTQSVTVPFHFVEIPIP